MTKIEIYRGNSGEIVKYLIEGHTGYSDAGTDIVCASVTTAALTAMNGLTDVIGLRIGYEVREGYLECILPKDLQESEQYGAKVLLDSMLLTFYSLSEQYPNYISITELEV